MPSRSDDFGIGDRKVLSRLFAVCGESASPAAGVLVRCLGVSPHKARRFLKDSRDARRRGEDGADDISVLESDVPSDSDSWSESSLESVPE